MSPVSVDTNLPTVVVVLNGGGEYRPQHVSALYDGVLRHWPSATPPRFVALTNAPINIPGIEERPLEHGWFKWWAKMELHSPAHADLGRVLFIDLDTVIVGSLVDVVSFHDLIMVRDFYRPEAFNSGIMMLPVDVRAHAWERWIIRPAEHVRRWRRGDGDFLDHLWHDGAVGWQDILPGQIVSYKVHVRRDGIPADARVICFHGRPRPWQVPKIWNGKRNR